MNVPHAPIDPSAPPEPCAQQPAAKKPLRVRALGPSEAAKKRLRLHNLEERSRSDHSQLAALARRTAKDAAQRDELLSRRETSRLRSAPQTIDRRRGEYTARCETPVSRSSRLFAASVLSALALPLMIALAANFTRVPLHESLSAQHRHLSPVAVHLGARSTPQRSLRAAPAKEMATQARVPIAATPADVAAAVTPAVVRAGPTPTDVAAAVTPAADGVMVAAIPRQAPSPVAAASAVPKAIASPLFQGTIWRTLYTSPPARASAPAATTHIDAPKAPLAAAKVLARAVPQNLWLTARPLGPHLMSLNWAQHTGDAKAHGFILYRSSREGERGQIIARLSSSRHSYRDRAVNASALYRYFVIAGADANATAAGTTTVVTPPELPAAMAATLAGKGMFLYFSSRLTDAHSYARLDPQTIMDAARNAGISFIELRMSRGARAMADTPNARAWLDRLIDASATANIKLLAWTVPRAVTAEDLAQSLAMARYRTAAGNGFVGLALDLESGDQYMGHGAAARNSMVAYIGAIRRAVGAHYLLVATVASPHIGRLTNDDVPYARIAAYADVLQPMEYWHYFSQGAGHEYGRNEVALATTQAVLRTRQLAGRDIPVNLAGQSVDLENTGSPSGREIMWSLGAAKSVGALGETFFDWAGTQPDGWAAIQAFEW